MTIAYHPSHETLAAYAAGTLACGPRLVLEAHLAVCPLCRRRLLAFESIGGALMELEPFEPAPVALLERTLARLDGAERRTTVCPRAAPAFPGAPHCLRGWAIGPWRFVPLGFQLARVSAPGESEASAVLVRMGAGGRLPRHRHEGVEYVQVLTGAFSDAVGRYGPGDFIEHDEEVAHQPIAEIGCGECLCLAAVDGRLRMTSLAGRMAQVFYHF
ncbi:MAG: ChrR family anti-sigma-E factor [Roseiarcus sp.]